MWHSFKELDRLLRGEATRLASLRRGSIDIAPDGMAAVILVLGLLYGLCMGSYALSQSGSLTDHLLQFISTTGKVPLLFGLTLAVTFPSLYVFNALVGSRLTLLSVLRLIIAALAIMLALLASFGPIVAFFSLSTTSYSFMLLLNVVIFSVAGFLGLKFLLHTLHRLTIVQDELPAEPSREIVPNELASDRAGALERLEGRPLGSSVTTIFKIWVVVFGLVGAQMSWVLRPFLGHPNHGFILFAPRESNFFEAVWHAFTGMF